MLALDTDADSYAPTQPSQPQRRLLCAFIVFSCTAFLVAIAMFVFPRLAEHLLPHYGWPVIGFFYAGALKYAIPPLLNRNPVPVHVYFRGISLTLRVLALYGVSTTALGWVTDDFDNPYLMVSVAQPMWTVAVPLVWLGLFQREIVSASRPVQNPASTSV